MSTTSKRLRTLTALGAIGTTVALVLAGCGARAGDSVSAGGTSALYAVLGHGAPANGIIALSGRMEAPDIPRHMRDGSQPPILQFVAENDLEHVARLTPVMQARSAEIGLRHSVFRVPRAGHFYPKSADVVGADGRTSTVEAEIVAFLAASES